MHTINHFCVTDCLVLAQFSSRVKFFSTLRTGHIAGQTQLARMVNYSMSEDGINRFTYVCTVLTPVGDSVGMNHITVVL